MMFNYRTIRVPIFIRILWCLETCFGLILHNQAISGCVSWTNIGCEKHGGSCLSADNVSVYSLCYAIHCGQILVILAQVWCFLDTFSLFLLSRFQLFWLEFSRLGFRFLSSPIQLFGLEFRRLVLDSFAMQVQYRLEFVFHLESCYSNPSLNCLHFCYNLAHFTASYL